MGEGQTSFSIKSLWQRHGATLLAVLLCLWSLPQSFCYAPGLLIDSVWVRTMNIAVAQHLSFGRDIAFTYGPLAILSTRNCAHFSPLWLLAGDLLLCAGLFHVLRKILAYSKNWFWVLLLAILCYKGAGNSQLLFLLFLAISVSCLKNRFGNYFEVAFCSITCVVLFLVKINYGFITFALLPFYVLAAFRYNKRAFFLCLVVTLCSSVFLFRYFHVALLAYMRTGIQLIASYDEAMFQAAPLWMAVPFLVVFACIIVASFFFTRRKGASAVLLIPALLLSGFCYLLYRNGFIRFDFSHSYDFYSLFPLFIAITILMLGMAGLRISKFIVLAVVLIAFTDLRLYPITWSNFKIYTNHALFTSVTGYFGNLYSCFRTPEVPDTSEITISNAQRQKIGNGTIDVIPNNVALLQGNQFNYHPRPVIQSYSAYSAGLDSLNARFFWQSKRPEWLMIGNESIDGRYPAWDESLTKAAIHLNYVSTGEEAECRTQTPGFSWRVLLFKSSSAEERVPVFAKIGEKTVHFDDTVAISFADSSPVYMSASLQYTLAGRVERLLFQPEPVTATLVTDAGAVGYRAVKPIIAAPVLISHFIGSNEDLGNFLSGEIRKNKPIRAVIFQKQGDGLKNDIHLSFYRFTNY